ncbi:MAG: hypothetical protein ABW252_03835 [Polyangiales bacterium]
MDTEHEQPPNDLMWLANGVTALSLMAVVGASTCLLAMGLDSRMGAFSCVAPFLLCCVAVGPLCKLRDRAARWFALPAEGRARTPASSVDAQPVAALHHALAVRVEGAEQCRAALDAGSALLDELRRVRAATHDAERGHGPDAHLLAEMEALEAQQRRMLREEVWAIDEDRYRYEMARLQWEFVATSREAWEGLRDVASARTAHAPKVETALELVQEALCEELAEGDLASSGASLASGSLYDQTWSRRIDALKRERPEPE